MKLKCLIIDDENNNLGNLSILLSSYCPDVVVIGTATSADEGKNLILSVKPDLIFLDIQMPGKTGFDLLSELPTHDFEVIFVTAYDNYGIQAIKYLAIDYLLKPISPTELQIAVKRAADNKQLKDNNGKMEDLVALLKQSNNRDEQRLALTTLKETRFVYPDQIIRCESSNNYTTFFLTNKEKILVSKPILEYEESLSNFGFVRSHQSHLVNKKYIESWVREDGGYLLLTDRTQIPVSRNKKEIVTKALSG